MEFDQATLKYNQIFAPDLIEEYQDLVCKKKRFAYYTSADTAIKVLRNQELWFRNATVMNDFAEISHGLALMQKVFSGPSGKYFREAVDGIFSGTIDRADKLLFEWVEHWQFETYIACLSIHEAEEDISGRLSMWRAYGDTAIVVNNTPMASITDLAAVFSTPVLYLSEEEFISYLNKITNSILSNREYLLGLGQDTLVSHIHDMAFRFAIASKHPGFKEEKEWRVFYHPTKNKSPVMTEDTVVLGGVPQTIFKLRLANEPHNGLYGADIPSLLDRIIIGPVQFPYMSYKAFLSVLEGLGIRDAESKIFLSDIPLRIN
ncbi:DUF2971 domain-containing protein [Thalassobaculum salexigens]|uniref:DUF2971 domain-containing protein n=1 Tax=Thalassobaculum salexigens TaxID=455360 RepID=UPI000A066FEA|nr:DUF2971 domain-containing protein [Thalassobaculum salexigens]